jgi:nitroreductase
MERTNYLSGTPDAAYPKAFMTASQQEIDPGVINRLLYAAMSAPAPIPFLPWKFIAVTDRPTLARLAIALPFAPKLSRAVAAIVVCALKEKAVMGSEAMAIIQCSCASQNILLTAQAMGFGTAWTSLYPNEDNMDSIRKQLQIPREVIPLNILPLVEMDRAEKSRSKYDTRNIFHEKWNNH